MSKLHNVMITGTGSGIGLSLATHLLGKGCMVFGGVISAEEGQRIQHALGANFHPIVIDVRQEADAQAAAKRVAAILDPAALDALVNVAGIITNGPLLELDGASLQNVLAVNVVGIHNVTRAFFPLLQRAGSARVVNMSSASGTRTMPFTGAYSASKFAVEALSTAMRMELAPFGISVSVVAPGLTRTPMAQKILSDLGQKPQTPQYARPMELFRAASKLAAEQGIAVEQVVATIEQVLRDTAPQPRYEVHNSYLRDVVLMRILPVRLREKIIRHKLGLLPSAPANNLVFSTFPFLGCRALTIMHLRHLSTVVAIGTAVLVALWWWLAAPAPYHTVPDPIHFDNRATDAARAVEQSDAFAAQLEHIAADIPGYDDIVFLLDGRTALVSAMDGQIWSFDRTTQKALPLVDVPLMAAGMHESPTHPDEVYFCASRLWGETYPASERVGLYRLRVASRAIEPVVLDVPTAADVGEKVWPLDDPTAPHLRVGAPGTSSRPLAFCNDLEISADGQRIYFSEPFAYAGASMGGGTVPEVIAYRGNGYVWQHDLAQGETRLVAQGIHFPDGILYDLHPGQAREDSIVTSQTTGFRILRLYLRGPRAGQSERVMDGLPGMCDGMDRDREGHIWCGMYARRTGFITWLHEHPWLKHVLLRLPLNWIPQPNTTGVAALSSDASSVLYSAWYDGPQVTHIASAIEGPDGYLYLAAFSRKHLGLTRLKNPLAVAPAPTAANPSATPLIADNAASTRASQ